MLWRAGAVHGGSCRNPCTAEALQLLGLRLVELSIALLGGCEIQVFS